MGFKELIKKIPQHKKKAAQTQPEEKKTEEKQEVQARINDNRESANVIKDRLEKLRMKISGMGKNGALTEERIEQVDKLLQSVQDKLDSPTDVLLDVKALDDAALELIHAIGEYLDKGSEKQLLLSQQTLCECLFEKRSSSSVRDVEYGTLMLRYALLELQSDVTVRFRDSLQKEWDETLDLMNRFRQENRDRTELSAIFMDQEAQLENAKQQIQSYAGLMLRIKSQMKNLQSLPEEISLQKLTQAIAEIEDDMRRRMEEQAAQIKEYREQSLRSMEASKLSREKIRASLPGISLESEEQANRLVKEHELAQEEAREIQKKYAQEQAAEEQNANQLVN